MRDKEHITKFCADTGLQGHVYNRPNGSVRMEVLCRQWADDLQHNYNIMPRKSLTLEPPRLEGDVSLSFICGYIDGDGCIGKDGSLSVMRITGTLAICEWVRGCCEAIAGMPSVDRGGRGIMAMGKVWVYQVKGRRADVLLSQLKAVNCPHLGRKWDKVQDNRVDSQR